MTADSKEVVSIGGLSGRRKWVFAAVGGVGVAALAGGLVALSLWSGEGGPEATPGGSPSATTSPSPTTAPSPDSTPTPSGVKVPDVAAASEIPWDEVGEGWFILGYDPEKTEAADPWDEWLLGSGETWLLSPTGEAFQGPQPPADSWGFAFWPGSEVWFGLPLVPEPAEGSCEPFGCGDVLAIDTKTGASRHPLKSQYWPEGLERTADGSIVRWLECCDFSEATVLGADGADTAFSVIGTVMGPYLTPDGTALVWFDLQDETPPVLVRTFFDGVEDSYALPDEEGHFVGWIDESTVLIRSFNFDDNYTVVDESWLAVDLATGLKSEWIPPVDDFDHFWSLTTGLWLWWFPDSPDPLLTNNDGTFQMSLECAGTYCDWHVSGDRLLWIEEWEPSTDDAADAATAGRQRLTLIDLTTGDRTMIFDAPEADGRVVDIMPHAATYE